jgi:hypothetical protein
VVPREIVALVFEESMIEVDHLSHVPKARERGLEAGVIRSRTAMEQDDRRPAAKDGTVRNELGAVHIEEELGIANGDLHVRLDSP